MMVLGPADRYNDKRPFHFDRPKPGANWVRPGSLKWGWRAVVGQQATLIADQKTLIAESNLALAA
jgi:hypothetical protein